ncbi:hypothetical protein ACX40Y_12695 [Sphingomonas sp. RS6]
MATTATAQTAKEAALDPDPAKAAPRCFVASTKVSSGDDRVDAYEVADAMWFMIEKARLTPAQGSIMAQLGNIESLVTGDPAVTAENASAIMALCATRWPRSAGHSSAIALPADAFDRQLMCLAVSSIVYGAAESEVETYGESEAMPALKAIVDRVSASLTDDELARHGIKNDEEMLIRFGAALGNAVQLGNLNSVIRACSAD